MWRQDDDDAEVADGLARPKWRILFPYPIKTAESFSDLIGSVGHPISLVAVNRGG